MRKLSILAGKTALQQIRDGGLRSEQVKIIPGAAGGPKFLVLTQLDRYLFGSWLKDRTEPLHMVGASIGAWRFSAVAQKDPVAAIEKLERRYIDEEYGPNPGRKGISQGCRNVMGDLIDPEALDQILNHPFKRVGWMVVRAHLFNAYELAPIQAMGLAASSLGNILSPDLLKLGFTRVFFRDRRDPPPYWRDVEAVDLSSDNYLEALEATGSVPLMMEGVRDIPGAKPGMYRDGGITDYHLAMDHKLNDGLVLYPHFSERVIPGWFDKKLTWRKPKYTDRVVLIAPSPEFTASLPEAKIPDRTDFERHRNDPEQRRRIWRTVVSRCQELQDELVEALEGEKIREWARPF